MKTLEEIKQMMAAGDTAQADEALKELLANEPDNLQAKMLYGTCRQLLGDEETFKRIHDELAPVMERMGKEEPKAETVSLWGKYQRLFEWLIAAGLISAAAGTTIWFLGSHLRSMLETIQVTTDAVIRKTDAVIQTCCAPNPSTYPHAGNKFDIPNHNKFTDTESDSK